MKILITGGAGFIGSHLTDRLIQEGHKVVVIDNLSTGKKENLNRRAKFNKIDILDHRISQIFRKEKPEVVFHYAASINIRKSIEDPAEDAKINILGSLNLIKNFVHINHKTASVKLFIFASTGAIYGEANSIPTPEYYPEQPLSPYGTAKSVVEKYLDYYFRNFDLNYISLRIANAYGPRQNSNSGAGVVAIFCDRMLSGKKIIINGDGKQTRDFIFIDDVVKANILTLEKEKVGIFNIGTGKETSINTISQKLKRLIGLKCKTAYTLSCLGEQKRSCLDFLKAKKELNWEPKINLEEGLQKTVAHLKNS